MTSAVYRTITIFWILNFFQGLAVLIPTGGNTTKALLGIGIFMFLAHSIAPIYFVWRNYDAWKNRLPFLPEKISTLAPRAYQSAVGILWVFVIVGALTALSLALAASGSKLGLPGAAFGGLTIGIASSILLYPLIFIELCFWYQRGFERGNSNPIGTCPTCQQVFDKG